MIAMTLAEIAAAVGGTAGRRRPATRGDRPGRVRLARGRPGRAVRRLRRGERGRARLRPGGASPPVRSRCSAPGRSPAPTVVVADPLAAHGPAGPRRACDRLPDLTDHRHHRVVRQDVHQGPASASCWPGSARPSARPGSFNNELGLPHTVLRADADTRFLVLEMGARGPGPPDLPVRDRAAHRSAWWSTSAWRTSASSARWRRSRRPRRELVEALPADGLAVLNADDAAGAGDGRRTPRPRWCWPARRADAAVRAEAVRLDERGRATLHAGRRRTGRCRSRLGVTRPAPGRQLRCSPRRWRWALGMPLADARRRRWAISGWSRTEGWMSSTGPMVSRSSTTRTTPTRRRPRPRCTRWPRSGTGRRRVAVLGYLAELGATERAGHEQVGRLAAELGVDRARRGRRERPGRSTTARWRWPVGEESRCWCPIRTRRWRWLRASCVPATSSW